MRFLAVLVVLLAGCSGMQTKVISSSPRTVSVQSFKGLADAQKVADVECSKAGRYARWIDGDVQYIFDCVN